MTALFMLLLLLNDAMCTGKFLLLLPVDAAVSQTDLLPPLTLKPLRMFSDIRYAHFMVPRDCVYSKISLSVSVDRHCKHLNISIFLRPLSIPVVSPLHADIPKDTVPLSDWYRFTLDFTEKSLDISVLNRADDVFVDVFSSKGNHTGSVEILLYCPFAGPWYIGAYFFGTSEFGCYITLFPQVVHEIITQVHQLSVFPPHSSSMREPGSSTEPSKLPETSKKLHFLSQLAAPRDRFSNGQFTFTVSPINTSVDHLFFRRRRSDSVSASRAPGFLISSKTGSDDGRISFNENKSAYHTLLSLELSPSEGRLFQLLVPAATSSLDFMLVDCVIVSSIMVSANPVDSSGSRFKSSFASTPTKDKNVCPIFLEGGRGTIPWSLAYHFKGKQNGAHSSDKLRSISHLSNFSLGSILRFDSLYGQDVTHYVYIRNLHLHRALILNISLFSNLACSPSDQPGLPTFDAHRHASLGSKRFTRLKTHSAPASQSSSGRRLQPPSWAVSLLPWVNPSWPRLIVRPRGSTDESDKGAPESDMFVDPQRSVHRSFEKCSIWNSPSRVSRMHAFAYHFTYQPRLGQYANGLHLSPWNSVNIPITLEMGLDTGGSLEISLQLNAFDLTIPVNETHTKPLPRQVVLHACFARHLFSSPYDFISLRRCALWFRLATSYGLAVSVAHAVSIALAEALATDQPSHRSERPPQFNTSFDDSTLDRSFLFLPYPTPGRWYLGLYAECYSTVEAFCSQDAAAGIDVGLVIRSSPCLNYRCRDTGEGASLSPSRIMDPKLVEPRPLDQSSPTTSVNNRWRPPWWHPSYRRLHNTSLLLYNDTTDPYDERVAVGEGYCVELIQHSIYASTCACPLGRAGLGCMRFVIEYNTTQSTTNPTVNKLMHEWWSGYSNDALWLALSNLAFVPAIFLAIVRQLWIPAFAYSYTSIFSALYHLCDTDRTNVPIGYIFQNVNIEPAVLDFRSHGFQFANAFPQKFRLFSRTCPLPIDVLSFCDFFGGVLSIWVTIIAAVACPLRYAQLAYLVFVLSLTVTVHVARHSTALFLVPFSFGLVLLIISWIHRSRRTKRLFPPVQWWILSLIPGLLFAGTGLCLFLSPFMARRYTLLHSLWHMLMGLSLVGFLPWPDRWRAALDPIIPRYVPLSCGGTVHVKTNSQSFSSIDRLSPHHLNNSPASGSLKESPATTTTVSEPPSWMKCKLLRHLFNNGSSPILRLHSTVSTKVNKLVELNFLLDTLVDKWPKCRWLLPHGYHSKCSEFTIRVNSVSPVKLSTEFHTVTCNGACQTEELINVSSVRVV